MRWLWGIYSDREGVLMSRLKVNKSLVLYTLIIFLAGVFSTGVWLTVEGYNIPWNSKSEIVQAAEVSPQSPASAFFGPNTIQKIVEDAGEAVVKIETTVKVTGSSSDPFFNDPFFREFFGDSFRAVPQSRESTGLGSGFIISTDGYILTNSHVVEGATDIKVYLSSRQEPYDAKIVGEDAELDLAIIKISAGHNLPVLKFGDSNQTKVGNWVIAIGNPYGLDHTVTVGVISAKGRPVNVEGKQFKDLIQTDASINPGNSGGPLLNLQGEVVGINTAINSKAQGIGFAIPSSTVQQVLDQLMIKGKVERPWLGVYIQPVTKELAEYFGLSKAEGALIGGVSSGSPAEKAGIQYGDIILEFNKKSIASPDDLLKAVKECKIGQKAVLLVHRNKKTQYVSVDIGEK